MLTHGHEEADTLISFQIIDTIRYDTFKEVHVRCSDTDVFSFSMDLDANGYLGTLNKLIMPAGVGAKYREIDIRERVNAVGKTKSATVVRLLEIPDGDWRRKFVRVSTKSWTESFMALSADDPIIESLTSLGWKPTHNDNLADPEFKDLERFVCQVYSKSDPYTMAALRWELFWSRNLEGEMHLAYIHKVFTGPFYLFVEPLNFFTP